MAGNKSKRIKTKVDSTVDSPDDNPYVVTLSNGVQVNLRPVPPYLIDKIKSTIPLPKPPIMEIETAWGGKEEWANENDATYKKELEVAQEKQADKLWKAEFILGIADEPPPDEEWTETLKMFDIEIPKDPKEKKLLWVETTLIAKGVDVYTLLYAIRNAARPTKEEISGIAESFRGSISWLKAAAEEGQ